MSIVTGRAQSWDFKIQFQHFSLINSLLTQKQTKKKNNYKQNETNVRNNNR